jgi:hypothetical protein
VRAIERGLPCRARREVQYGLRRGGVELRRPRSPRIWRNEYLRYAEEHPGHYAMLFHTELGSDERHDPPQDVRKASRAALQMLVDVFAQRLDPAAAHEATMTMWTGLHGRAHLAKALPWMELPDQNSYLAALVAQTLRS